MERESTQAMAVLGALELRSAANTEGPLYRRLIEAIRREILSGTLAAGSRLPPSRTLAQRLRISRNTVIQAYDQLAAEGYIESRVGQGTRVAPLLPELLRNMGPRGAVSSASGKDKATGISARGEHLTAAWRSTPARLGSAFVYGMPSIENFPFPVWGRLLQRHNRRPDTATIAYPKSGGLPALQAAVANYLGPARGVNCQPDQVIIVSSAQAALDITTRLLLDTGDTAWIEDPGYRGARTALLGAGASVVPISVDESGMDIASAPDTGDTPRLVYVTPSSQFPTGSTMSLERRLLLLDRVRKLDAWVIEDDYDSEYRYRGRPLTALQGLDVHGRVIYIGTFSKTLFPGLRVAYLVVPHALVEPFGEAVRNTGQESAQILQAALADFISEGHFAAHVRRMRIRYAKRQAALKDAVIRSAQNHLRIHFRDAGMHALAYLDGINDIEVSTAAKLRGVIAAPLSPLYLGSPRLQGLILGYTSVPEDQYDAAVGTLIDIIDNMPRTA